MNAPPLAGEALAPRLTPLERVTLTGADERTSLQDLQRLVENPRVEIGLLYSARPEGRNRYPSRPWLESTIKALGRRCALHVCGTEARQQLRDGALTPMVAAVGRVQVNGKLSVEEAQAIGEQLHALPNRPAFITQHCEVNLELATAPVKNHQLLVDSSGGAGVSPKAWLRPATSKPAGFAGGLGVHNLLRQLPGIDAAARPGPSGSWVDMESRIRFNDYFSPLFAKAAVAAFDRYCLGLHADSVRI